jgi:hypothetical protein
MPVDLTPAAWQLLRESVAALDRKDYEAAEIVCEGIEAWIGHRRTTRATVKKLLDFTLVSEEYSDGRFGGGYCVYLPNETGRAALRRPELIAEILDALMKGGSFTIQNDRIVPLDPSGAPPFNLDAALVEAGMTLADLQRMTGKSRVSLWRWRRGKCPAYVRTIIEQARLQAKMPRSAA